MAGHVKWWSTLAVSFCLLITVAPACWGESDARSEWTRKIVLQLEHHKRFPPNATGQNGTAKVGFTIDRVGNLMSTELLQSAGFPLLDAEALAVVSRASPYPQPPADADFDDGKLVLPMKFATNPTTVPSSRMMEDTVPGKEDAALNQKLHSICRGC